MNTEVHSFDVDGCLFNPTYLDQDGKKNVVAANLDLLNLINRSRASKVIYIGSNRQSIADDHFNSKRGKGSCFHAIQHVTNYLSNATLDPFLLSDLYNDLEPGDSYQDALKALDATTDQYDVEKLKLSTSPDWLHDTGKLTILYAQIHKFALENQERELTYLPKKSATSSKEKDESDLPEVVAELKEIEFNFYDDKEEILKPLHQYFTQHPELIPKHMTLKLHGYVGAYDEQGKKITPLLNSYPPIRGTGEIDADYKNTVKTIAAVTLENTEGVVSAESPIELNDYPKAKSQLFKTSPINCIKQYLPGMKPEVAIEPVQAPSLRKNRLSSLGNLFGLMRTLSNPRGSATSSGSTSPRTDDQPLKKSASVRGTRARSELFARDDNTAYASTSSAAPSRSPSPPKEQFFRRVSESMASNKPKPEGYTRFLSSFSTSNKLPTMIEEDDNSMDSALTSSHEDVGLQ